MYATAVPHCAGFAPLHEGHKRVPSQAYRSSLRRILPMFDLGSDSRNSITFGSL